MYKIREDFWINYEMKKFKIREGRKSTVIMMPMMGSLKMAKENKS